MVNPLQYQTMFQSVETSKTAVVVGLVPVKVFTVVNVRVAVGEARAVVAVAR